MSEVRGIGKNLLSIGIAHLAAQAITLVISIIIARELGIENYGVYAFSINFPAFFLLLSNLGLDFVFVVDIAKDKSLAYKYLSNIIVIRLCLSIVVILLIILVAHFLGYAQEYVIAIILLGISSVIVSFGNIFLTAFRAFERMEYITLVTLIERSIALALIIGLSYFNINLILISIVIVFTSSLLVLLGMVIFLGKFKGHFEKPNISSIKKLTRKGLPFLIGAVIGVLLFQTNVVLLTIIKDPHATGIFNAGFSLSLTFIVLPSLYSTTILPTMSRYSKVSMEKLRNLLNKSYKYFFIIGLPISVGGAFLAEPIVTLFFGPEYRVSSQVFAIGIWVVSFLFLSTGSGPCLAALGLQRLNVFSGGLSAIVNVVLCLSLIPSLSYIGSAFAFVIANVTGTIIQFYFISTRVEKIQFIPITVKPILAVLIMSLIFIFYPYIGLLPTVIAGMALYFSILIVLKTFQSEDKRILVSIIRGDRNKSSKKMI